MAEFILKARTALNQDQPVNDHWNGLSIREIEGEQVWWVSVGSGQAGALAGAIEAQPAMAVPQRGRFVNASSGWILADAGERQYFLIGPDTAPIPQWPAGVHAAAQSDGWVALVVEGKATREVLSRLCGLDLHRAVFPRGSAARSPFEGMLAVILCLEDDVRPAYRILFQRSSARSFVDHLRHAAARVCGPAVPGSGAAH